MHAPWHPHVHRINVRLSVKQVLVPNINLLIYTIHPPPGSSNMFLEHKLNCVSLKFTNHFKETDGSKIIIINNGGLKLMDDP